MMGYQAPNQGKLFYTDLDIELRIRADHPLRKIALLIDFNFSYQVVADCYGHNGQVSVPPPVLLKLMFLLFFYNIRSERELMLTLPERLDWLWFLGYDLDSPILNHSVLSKARKRWGQKIFQEFFERIVWQCVEAGLVDGAKIFMDSSFIAADASKNSIVDRNSLKLIMAKRYQELESRLDETQENESQRPYRDKNNRLISTTDPEAGIVKNGNSTLHYKTHRVVEDHSEIITAVEVTSGDVNEGHRLKTLCESHEKNTEKTVETVVADSQYGTISNYLYCQETHRQAHIPEFGTRRKKSDRNQLFSDHLFKYDEHTDTYICPAGKNLKKRSYHIARNSWDYSARKRDCAVCELRTQCTKNKAGRTIK